MIILSALYQRINTINSNLWQFSNGNFFFFFFYKNAKSASISCRMSSTMFRSISPLDPDSLIAESHWPNPDVCILTETPVTNTRQIPTKQSPKSIESTTNKTKKKKAPKKKHTQENQVSKGSKSSQIKSLK